MDVLCKNPWLVTKTDRDRRLREHMEYVERYCQEMDSEPGVVVDIGPGPGEFLELAQAMGHKAIGVDAKTGAGGMGEQYLDYSRLMVERQNLDVDYRGFEAWVLDEHHDINGGVAFINSRGSIEQALCRHMLGDPHDEHHQARLMRWSMSAAMVETFEAIFLQVSRMLRAGGAFLIHANGAENVHDYDTAIVAASAKSGLSLVLRDGPRLHKWRKMA